MIALRPVLKIAYLHPGETVQPALGNEAVVEMEWLELVPLVVVTGTCLLAWMLAGEVVVGAD